MRCGGCYSIDGPTKGVAALCAGRPSCQWGCGAAFDALWKYARNGGLPSIDTEETYPQRPPRKRQKFLQRHVGARHLNLYKQLILKETRGIGVIFAASSRTSGTHLLPAVKEERRVKQKNTATLLTGALVLALLSANANALSITTYTDKTSYESSVGALVFLLDFTGLVSNGADGNFPGQVDFGSPEATDPALVNLNERVGDTGSTVAPNGVGPIGGELAAPTFAMGMEILSGSISGIDLYDASDALISSVSISASGFVGLSSDMAFSSFIVRNGVFTTGGNDRVFIDNFQVNGAPAVPLPPTALLLLGGVLALRAYRQKN